MVRAKRTLRFEMTLPLLVLGVMLTITAAKPAHAQDESGACPCFSHEEVAAIFEKMNAEGGSGSCLANDYSVELSAEVSVFDANFATVGEAGVKWADYETSRCSYSDKTADPPIDRNDTWPHPAPEATARACFDIIRNAITELDTLSYCSTYP